MLPADRGSGASGYGCEAGVGGEVSSGGEVLAGDLGEESGCGPDADSGHARQDGLKRVPWGGKRTYVLRDERGTSYDNPYNQAKCYQPYSRYRFHRLKISRQSFRKSLSEIPRTV